MTSGVPAKRKEEVWRRDKFRCRYCSVTVERPTGKPQWPRMATVDHVKPRSQGGSNRKDNLVTACSKCNCQKADSADWVPKPRKKIITGMRNRG